MNLDTYLESRKEQVDRELDRLLPAPSGPASTLARAMRYAVLGGGKRLRPVLALCCCETCGGVAEDVLAPAAALEMIHSYSLIHDDLPAMDDDDLRRGRPTVHRAFGEAVAILAGDALLTLAFEVLGTEPAGEARASRRAEAVAMVARRAGIAGMVGGQHADLDAQGREADGPSVEWIHRHKTGALIAASAELGAIHAAASPARRDALIRYGEAVGLAFQIVDDILDRTGTAETLGKTPGKDRGAAKATYPAVYGLEASRAEAERLIQLAFGQLAAAGLPGTLLESLARHAVSRVA